MTPEQRDAAKHVAWGGIRPHLQQLHGDQIRIQRAESDAALAAGGLLVALDAGDEEASNAAASALEAALDAIEALNMEEAFGYSGAVAELLKAVRREFPAEEPPSGDEAA